MNKKNFFVIFISMLMTACGENDSNKNNENQVKREKISNNQITKIERKSRNYEQRRF